MADIHLTIPEIALRLILAMFMGGAIGFERQYKSRPAGLRTHILVCMGACVIALIQVEIAVTGLTTAASLWAIAGLGIAIGMGFYPLAISSFVGIFFALAIVKRIVKVPTAKKLEIQYFHRAETKEFLTEYFQEKKINIEDVNFDVKFMEDYRVYTNIYTINLPKGLRFSEVIEELSVYKNITKIRLVDIA